MQSKRKRMFFSFIISHFIFIVFIVSTATAVAQEEIKARMEARLPVIDALKAKGVVGENNRGYLEFRGAPERADIVTAENADRSALFSAIATREDTTQDFVGRRFAIKFRDLARPGEWFQDDAGTWRKK